MTDRSSPGDTRQSPLRALPAHPNLDHLRKEAKRRLKDLRQSAPGALLAEAQRDVARDYGFTSWRRLVALLRPIAANTPELPYDWGWDLARVTAEAQARGDDAAVESAYRALIARKPPGVAELEANFALFLLNRPDGGVEARAIFRRLLRTPTATILAHYASFAQAAGMVDLEGREEIYRRAVAMGDNLLAAHHYAAFLWHERGIRTEALRLARIAAEGEAAHPLTQAIYQGIYATMAWRNGDAVTAETWFRLARTRSKSDVYATLAFAHMLTTTGQASEGLKLAAEVTSHPRLPDLGPLMAGWFSAVVNFLLYAHGDVAQQTAALLALDAAPIPAQAASDILDLWRTVEAATANGHQAPRRLVALAQRLTGQRTPSGG
ncbi:tetratricopeptide repeat protein [Nitrospirillum pindoramense]|uniref:Tetratricopeptide repeat protein n=1 Tax=Nitrospirillum amazonense TaxID=28077 RepID=A0A560HFU1_9PROT|nr:hypothetical protein [Nitrospirillum amazonense]TWB45303.1 hypothetical protein FBZ90_102260 [Nitrospirillum amazonense]